MLAHTVPTPASAPASGRPPDSGHPAGVGEGGGASRLGGLEARAVHLQPQKCMSRSLTSKWVSVPPTPFLQADENSGRRRKGTQLQPHLAANCALQGTCPPKHECLGHLS